ncbi:MAG: GH116 family glycosyl-hydrolase, partial [candidate division KSB1 bacterium]|nr:GH116 family glycosyl-hydrolase [candidate division KSB1 bacterium]
MNCLNVGIELSLLAFSPLVLGEDGKQTRYKDSSLPVAIFCYQLKNPGLNKLQVSIAFSWHNLAGVGGYSGRERWIEGKLIKPPFIGGIEDTKDNFCQFQTKDGVQGLWFSHHGKKQDPRVEGNYSLLIEAPAKGHVSYFAGWDVDGDGWDFWEDFSTDGRFNDTTASGNAGALACSLELKPGQEEMVIFVVGWYFPNLLASINHTINYGHAYGNWFQDSWEAASYALTNWRSLLEKTEAWQKRLTESNLPDWFITQLINDLFPLFTNSWYTQDFRFASNESPTHMNGCLGTIDQRAASNSIYTMAFPELAKAELKLFGDQQIEADHPNRYGTHWNFQTGAFDLKLDRLGAIRHDVGWDDLEGGALGDKKWTTLHWPDLVTVYTLQAFEYYLWTNDKEFFDYVYPKIKLALEFENRLDQDGDGIAELWGPGSHTYDSEAFPYFGASPFVATLHLAALRAAEQMADWKGDTQFKIFCQNAFYKVHQSLMEKLWDDQRGHFHNWVDSLYTNWAVSERPHSERSESCFIGQLAGTWFTRLLNLEPILDKETEEQALAKMTELNHHLVSHCPANEVTPEGKASASWIYYVETYYCANCIYGNQKDAGFEAEKKIARAKYQTHQSPWDSPLNWEGAGNSVAGWGRWYMTNPASWFVLLAIEGIHLNLP